MVYSLIIFALLAGLGGVFVVSAETRAAAAFDTELVARARTIATGQRVADGTLVATNACAFRAPLDLVAVYDRGLTPLCAAPQPESAQNATVRGLARTPNSQPVGLRLDSFDMRAVAQQVRGADGAIVGVIVVGRIAPPPDTLRSTLLFGLPLGFALSVAVGLLLARLGTRDTTDLSRALTKLVRSDISRRLPMRGGAVARRLRQTVNALLDKLAESHEQQRRFVADASHELRTPLSVIEAEATLALRRERGTAEYRQTLNIVVGETEHIRRLIDDLLTLARADAGLADVLSQPVDLTDVVVDAVERVGAMAEQKGLALAPRLPADTEAPPMVAGDAALLERMLGNLLKNAIAYTPSGGRIEAGVRREANACHLWVSDSGIGIAPEHLPRIFDRFYRAQPTNSRAESGGLGLAICRWVALAHGGRIDVASTPGQGSVFIVSLPLLNDHESARVIRNPLAAPDPVSFTSAITAPVITISAPSALTMPVTTQPDIDEA